MPRLFTGLEIPPDIGTRLALSRGGLPGARWIEPADYHVTLSFIGDVDDRLGSDIADMLDAVRRPAFRIALGNYAAFGGERPRSVHATVEASPPLLDLQAAQETMLRRVGAPIDARQFRPHVTLARLRQPASARHVADWLSLHSGERIAFEVQRFVLFSSRESVGGGPYIVEASYDLD